MMMTDCGQNRGVRGIYNLRGPHSKKRKISGHKLKTTNYRGITLQNEDKYREWLSSSRLILYAKILSKKNYILKEM